MLVFIVRVFVVILSISVVSLRAAEPDKSIEFPREKNGDIILYEAGADNPVEFSLDTGTWIKGGDCIPSTKLVDGSGGKWLEFNYTGGRGVGRALLDCKTALMKMRSSDEGYIGLKLIIECSKPGNLIILPITKNGTGSSVLRLLNGEKEYIIKKIISRKIGELSWNQFTGLAFFRYANTEYDIKQFRLKKIVLMIEKKKSKFRVLETIMRKKVQELIRTSSPIIDGKFNSNYIWTQCSTLKDFTYYKDNKKVPATLSPKVFVGWGGGRLFFRSESYFPTKPKSMTTRRDGLVWQDESLEFFFSAEHDNNQKIQYVVNAQGIVYDYAREYDAVSCMIMNRMQRNFKPIQNFSYNNNIQVSQIAFALKDLKIDLKKERVVAFQFVQNYDQSRFVDGLHLMRWAPAPFLRNTSPEGFGLLVFNKKPFGPGAMKIKKVMSSIPQKGAIYADFKFEIATSGLIPSEYTIKQFITAPDSSIFSDEKPIVLGGEKTFSLGMNAKNLNGIYTVRIELHNKNGDVKVAAVNFKNVNDIVDIFDKKLIWPRPKRVLWQKGAFTAGGNSLLSIRKNASPRTLKTAELFAEKLFGFAGSEYAIKKSISPAKGIVLKIDEEVEFNGKKETLKPEGYRLKVTPEKVEIVGADESGLFYGTVTFMQLLKMPMKRLDNAPVQCVDILDWPDIENRLGRFWPPTQIGYEVKEMWDAEFLMNWIDRFVAGNKLNRLWIDITRGIIFKRRPETNFNKRYRQLTLGDLKKISEFCRDRFIEIIPAMPLGGHGEGRLVKKEFNDPVWKATDNVAHPEYFPWVEGCVLDILEATNCKYFTPKLDEWWHKRRGDVNDMGLVNGKTRPAAMLDFLVKLHALLKEHKVRMIVYEDMLNATHNGRRYECWKITDKLPKDIIVSCWSWKGGAYQVARYFTDKGFELWGNETGFQRLPIEARKLHKGFGASLYASFGTGREQRQRASYDFLGQWFVAADYAWNFLKECDENKKSLSDELNNGVLPKLHDLFALDPNPYASQAVLPIDISTVANASVNAKKIRKTCSDLKLPLTLKEIGNIPTLLLDGDKNCVFVGEKEKVTFPVKGEFSSLIFLQSGLPPVNYLKSMRLRKFNFRTWQKGWPYGAYTIKYVDGKEIKIRIHNGAELYWMNLRPRDGGCLQTRYVLPIKRNDGQYAFLYQWEWENPRPFIEITSVLFEDEPDMPLETLIFAISGRKTKHIHGARK